MEKRWYLTPEDFARAKEVGVRRTTLHSRVYRLGWDVEKAITHPLNHVYTDAEKQLMKDNGISMSVLYYRKKQGMTFEEAVSMPLIPKQRSKVFTGEEREQLEKLGISLSAAINRKRRGWSKEKIFNTPPREGKRHI